MHPFHAESSPDFHDGSAKYGRDIMDKTDKRIGHIIILIGRLARPLETATGSDRTACRGQIKTDKAR